MNYSDSCMADTRSALAHVFKWLAIGLSGLGITALMFTHGDTLAETLAPLSGPLATLGEYAATVILSIFAVIAFPFWLLTFVSEPLSVLSVMPHWTLGGGTFMPQVHSFFVVLAAIPFIARRFSGQRWAHDTGNTILALALVGIPMFAWGTETVIYAISSISGFDIDAALAPYAASKTGKNLAANIVMCLSILMFFTTLLVVLSAINPPDDWRNPVEKMNRLEPVWVFPARLAGTAVIAIAFIGGLYLGTSLALPMQHWFATLTGGVLSSFIAGGSALMAYSATIGCKRY